MSFDKIKAMRNAERFLAQGKIRAAINEYKRVVESDPKDFSTLNMLGDLYAKASDTQEAIKCFNLVAEYYGKQGFAQKAIAVYNKISRLTPGSLEISAKLAELYQMKGSVAEARSHYNVLADHYQRKGNKAEALGVLKQIAQLDPNNTEIYLKIAETCLQDNQQDEAAAAFIEAGKRLSAKKQYEIAIHAFSKGLEIRPNDLDGLKGVVTAQISLGYTDEAAKTLEKVLENEPHNREILFLLIDCYLDTNNAREAERAVIQLVEREPANYPKFLDVVKTYLKENDLESAARILAMTAEHLLVGGQAPELEKWINEILARNPEQIEALRLLVHLHGWQRDEAQLKESLDRLAEAARLIDSVEDERYALTQLVLMMPYEASFAQRLQEINEAHGYADVPVIYQPSQAVEEMNPELFAEQETPVFETFAVSENGDGKNLNTGGAIVDYGNLMSDPSGFAIVGATNGNGNGNGADYAPANESAALPAPTVLEYGEVYDSQAFAFSTEEENLKKELGPFEQARLQQELESVEFYITQGYTDLAVQSLELLESELGKRPEIEEFRQKLNSNGAVPLPEPPARAAERVPAPAVATAAIETIEAPAPAATEDLALSVEKETGTSAVLPADGTKTFDILDEFRSELGLEETEPEDDGGDYETHYQLGIAYKEMGLMEDAIREFQDAVNRVSVGDGTRRFFQCSNMLGHCFMEKQMPNLALMWYKRCLESASLTVDERQGMRYEVANAYEAGADYQKAIEYFEQIYVENVDYRDVAERLKFLRAQ